MNNGNNKFEILFWKVFHNKYLLNLIFIIMKNDVIEFDNNNLNKYYLGFRMSFEKIRSFNWFLDKERDTFKLLIMKMEAKEKLVIERSAFCNFISKTNTGGDHVYRVAELFFTMKYYNESFGTIKSLVENCIKYGNLSVLKCIIDIYNFRIERMTFRAALTSNSIEVVEYLHKVIEQQTLEYQDQDQETSVTPLSLFKGPIPTDYDPDKYNFQDSSFKKGIFLLALHHQNGFFMDYILKRPYLYERVSGYCKISISDFNKIKSPKTKIEILEMDLIIIQNFANYGFNFTLSDIIYQYYETETEKEELMLETMKFYSTLVYLINNQSKTELQGNIKFILSSPNEKFSNQQKILKSIEFLFKEFKKINNHYQDHKITIDKSIYKYYFNELDGKELNKLLSQSPNNNNNVDNNNKNKNNNNNHLKIIYLSTFESCSINGLKYLLETKYEDDFGRTALEDIDFKGNGNDSKVLEFFELYKKNEKINCKFDLSDSFITLVLEHCSPLILEKLLVKKYISAFKFIENKDLFLKKNSISVIKWFINNKIINSTINKILNNNNNINNNYNDNNNSNHKRISNSNSNKNKVKSQLKDINNNNNHNDTSKQQLLKVPDHINIIVTPETEQDIDFMISLNQHSNYKLFGNATFLFSSLDLLRYYKDKTNSHISLLFINYFKDNNKINTVTSLKQLVEWSQYLEKDEYFGFTSIEFKQLIQIYSNIYILFSNQDKSTKELHEILSGINISKFPVFDLLFNSLSLSTIKLILENPNFNIEDKNNQNHIVEYLNYEPYSINLRTNKFYDDHSTRNIKISQIISIVKYLLFKLSDNSIFLFHQYFKKVYKRALICQDATLEQVQELNELFKQFSIPLCIEFYHIYYYLRLKSNKFIKYLDNLPILSEYMQLINDYNKGIGVSTLIFSESNDTKPFLNNSTLSFNYIKSNSFNDIFLKLWSISDSSSNIAGIEKSIEYQINFLASIHNIPLLETFLLSIDPFFISVSKKYLNKLLEKLKQVFNDSQIQNIITILNNK